MTGRGVTAYGTCQMLHGRAIPGCVERPRACGPDGITGWRCERRHASVGKPRPAAVALRRASVYGANPAVPRLHLSAGTPVHPSEHERNAAHIPRRPVAGPAGGLFRPVLPAAVP
ncbi:hypothetical protein DDE01_27960 [Desulfovibrio desulfuricans]|nr:hypothetical protein DDE01_27960 [Desulfovibrio desulfuricans]